MRAGVRLDEGGKELEAAAAEVRARGVHAEHGVEALGFLVDRREARIAEHVAAIGGEHRADAAELAHRATQLRGGRVGVLHRQQRHGFQPRALAREFLVHERVVGAAERDRPLAIAQERHEETERRIEHRRLHAAAVHRFQPRVRAAREFAERAEHAPVPAVPGIEEHAGRPTAIRLVEISCDLLLGLGDVAVGVDDGHGLLRAEPSL